MFWLGCACFARRKSNQRARGKRQNIHGGNFIWEKLAGVSPVRTVSVSARVWKSFATTMRECVVWSRIYGSGNMVVDGFRQILLEIYNSLVLP